jgi:hypothetical protein
MQNIKITTYFFDNYDTSMKIYCKSGMVASACNPILRRLRQEDHKFKAAWGYIGRTLSQKKVMISRNFNLFLFDFFFCHCKPHYISALHGIADLIKNKEDNQTSGQVCQTV